MRNLRFFRGSFLVTFIGALLGYLIGGFEALFLIFVLSVLEISLSFDNAVVNATVLKKMDALWRKRFLTWGILISVFGMRVIFPVAVVSVVAGVSPWSAILIAINSPSQYQVLMQSAHISLMGFGGSFLLLVGLDFFLNEDKTEHWIGIIERPLLHIGKLKFSAPIFTVLGILLIAGLYLPDADQYSFIASGASGIVAFTLIHKISAQMEKREDRRASCNGTVVVAKSSLGMFLYLELLDASFSFDGVIGAFAITTNLLIIATGLGIGAMFVRSLTIMFVENNVLEEYQYLQHGAFYAVIALAIIMFLKTFIHVPEILTGLIGAGFIALAFIHSLIASRKNNKGT
ncbi:hypothetical protein PCNPT3_05560 [Psychromonas sp. CNPT3]|uniref:DUF475 domain-containing protein n=1 Tax=Psychromonas sp. CNPT3 TaxID=314282 RepID=UPI00006E3905|nr:DUF475 domain-containing protein [Psychromonas sp. CNPT3]AGH81054.1 hypothetical protein PCNPT3_05560 [Psychromonas sp. CNPT3]